MECKGCALCCIGEMFRVSLDPDEVVRFAESERDMGKWGLWLLKQREDGTCVLLDRETMTCMRYEDRPRNCASYKCEAIR